jgi:hypothetical protein
MSCINITAIYPHIWYPTSADCPGERVRYCVATAVQILFVLTPNPGHGKPPTHSGLRVKLARGG